jgi:UDP-N-acetylmuramoylalanine--D-glutamate ligase
MKAAIIGYGVEGVVSAAYWHAAGYEVTVCDQNTELTHDSNEYAWQLGPNYLAGLDSFDVIVRSAGIHPRILYTAAPQSNLESKVTTSVAEFMRVCPTPNVIGVTGTKGKGTTSTLIAKILQETGATVHLGGNIGVAALEMLPAIKPEDWVVLELSSFQLEDFKGPSPRIAVCLMIVPEHLNWHASFQEYKQAKSNLFRYQTATDTAIYFADNADSQEIASSSPAQTMPFAAAPGALVENDIVAIDGQTICQVSELLLPGKHNWQNVCAAITATWQATQDIAAIRRAVTSFSGLPHRIEHIGDHQNISFYDDSFATTPETSIAAIDSFSQPISIIIGGSDKGIPFDQLAQKLANSSVKHVTYIGETGSRIHDLVNTLNPSLSATVFAPNQGTMREFVADALSHCATGDIVLLSTGCASFGLFKDYKDRAAQFCTAVAALTH